MHGMPVGTSASSGAKAKAAAVCLPTDGAASVFGTVIDVDGPRTSDAVIAGA
jgi:hypothetical protein